MKKDSSSFDQYAHANSILRYQRKSLSNLMGNLVSAVLLELKEQIARKLNSPSKQGQKQTLIK